MRSHNGDGGSRHQTRDEATNQIRDHEKRKKRFQACVACRATKTKCLPSTREDSCQSCFKNSRPCVMPGPPKPRIKSAQKFSELEKKIELLTHALAAKDHDPQDASDTISHEQNPINSEPLAASSPASSLNGEELDGDAQTVTINAQSELPKSHKVTQPDVLGEGLFAKESATALFLHWKTHMHPFMPLVFLDADVDIEQIRHTRPMVFLAILTISSAAVYPALSAELVKRLTQALGRLTFEQNEPSIDAVLAILLFSQYFFQTNKSTTLPPSQYIYTAVAMITDLGLHFKAKGIFETTSSSNSEAVQVCLSEWYAASMTCVLLHRTPLVQYSEDLERYATILHNRTNSLDSWTISLYKLQHIIERAALLVDPLENKSERAFDEPGTQYKVNMLQQQLESWQRDLPENVDERFRKHAYHAAYLRIHAIAVRCYVRKAVNNEQRRDYSTQNQDDALMGLTPLHFDCLTKCLTSIKALFDIYLSLEILTVRSLPVSYLFWNMNAAVLLVKLGHFGELLTKHEQRPIAHENNTTNSFKATVVYYLDAIVAKMEQAARGEHLPQAKAYIRVLRKLKPYYLQKRAICISAKGEAVAIDEEGDCPPFAYTKISHQQPKEGNTALALASATDIQMQSENGNQTYHHSPQQQQQTLSSTGGLSHSGWTPSSISSQGAFYTPSATGSHNDPFADSSMNMTAAYDPYTYANTDWTAFPLGQEDYQQLDNFMWSEEDTAWMQSLL